MTTAMSVFTTDFTVNGKTVRLDTARLMFPYAMKGGVDFETMLLDCNDNCIEEAHARTYEEAKRNHTCLYNKYATLFNSYPGIVTKEGENDTVH